MKSFLYKLLVFIALGLLLITTVSFLPLKRQFLVQELADTQYEKVVWIMESLRKGSLQKHYKGILIGSSQCLYGINDSLLGNQYLNLGVNTPSRDLDLYITQLIEDHNITYDTLYRVLGTSSPIHYGTHRVMPFLVSPAWYLYNGQSILSAHFWRFILNRSSKVVISWLSYGNKQVRYQSDFTRYGARKLETINNNSRLSLQESEDFCVSSFSFWDELRYNYKSQDTFFDKLNSSTVASYILIPSYQTPTDYANAAQKMRICFPDVSIHQLDSTQIAALIDDRDNWADNGHLSSTGSIIYSHFLLDNLTR